MNKLLLCTDMDRTVIPNGPQPEADDARPSFKALSGLALVCLVYVTGRHLQLMLQAIEQYDLPEPDYAITDVGSRIYYKEQNQWSLLQAWQADIDQDWQGIQAEQIHQLLANIDGIKLQEAEKQNTHKISFYVDLALWNEQSCLAEVNQRLSPLTAPPFAMQSNLIWSIDESSDIGLLDILPAKANKLHAIHFLQDYLGYQDNELVFAGDSGNDLPVLSSKVQSVLVANATDEVRNQALEQAQQQNTLKQLYLADNQAALSGNYSAGVVQGVCYFMPQIKKQLQAAIMDAKHKLE